MSDDQELTLEDEGLIDRICLDFEAAFRAGEAPEAAAFLERAPERLRGALGAELDALHEELGRTVLPGTLLEGSAHDPKRIGQFEVVRRIGEGGMGTVYEALQDHPRRRVAIKVVRADLANAKLIKRFRREVGVLGHLHHPSIAQIYDAGTARSEVGGSGLPYLVMEFVPGDPLITHARTHDLDQTERIKLVITICSAVQHAHDQGVIHRDLKPANVLVRPADSREDSGRLKARGEAHPVVLDFGLASATDPSLVASLQTEVGQIVGTLSHMSPEQIEGLEDRVDARSDIYALGVILYELLGDRLPIDLAGATLPEAIQRVRTVDPAPLGSIDRRLRGDVEIIVAKALEKDPARRYPTAAELGADLLRAVNNEPIHARPPSAIYQLTKFARRNPVMASALAATAVATLVALALVSVYAVREGRLRRRAELEREKVAAVAGFQQRVIEGANLDHGGDPRATTLLDAVRSAENEIDGTFDGAPEVEAAIRKRLGEAFRSLMDIESAEKQSRRAYELLSELHGDLHPETQDALGGLARVVEMDGRFGEAKELHERTLEIALELYGPEAHETLATRNNLATTLESLGQWDEAIAMHREVLAARERSMGAMSLQAASSLNNLASLLELRGQLDEAEVMFRRCLTIREKELESPHRYIANAMNNLGGVLLKKGRLEEAEERFSASLAMCERLYGTEHGEVTNGLNNLAVLYLQQGKELKAAEFMERALRISIQQFGNDHPQTNVMRSNVVSILRRAGEVDVAYEKQVKNVELLRESFGETHEKTIRGLNILSACALEKGNLEEALSISVPLLAQSRRLYPTDPVTANVTSQLAEARAAQGEIDEAESLYGEAIAHCEEHSPSSSRRYAIRNQLAAALKKAGRLEEAKQVAEATYDEALGDIGPDHRFTVAAKAILDE
ncbi:MAG: serine/threonine-protein kinase [Planctomycetota bacterium]